MPMSYSEAKNIILTEYEGSIADWHRIVGAMFEATNGFTKSCVLVFFFLKKHCNIYWCNYEWVIEPCT